MRRNRLSLIVSLAGVLCVSGAALASIDGIYRITVETTMTPPNCKWIGNGRVWQNGASFMGTSKLTLDLTSGPDPLCATYLPALSGSLQGTISSVTPSLAWRCRARSRFPSPES